MKIFLFLNTHKIFIIFKINVFILTKDKPYSWKCFLFDFAH